MNLFTMPFNERGRRLLGGNPLKLLKSFNQNENLIKGAKQAQICTKKSGTQNHCQKKILQISQELGGQR